MGKAGNAHLIPIGRSAPSDWPIRWQSGTLPTWTISPTHAPEVAITRSLRGVFSTEEAFVHAVRQQSVGIEKRLTFDQNAAITARTHNRNHWVWVNSFCWMESYLMELIMRRNNSCKPDTDFLRATEVMVSETVTYFRNRGHAHDVAIDQASIALGLTRRRTWTFYYQQPAAAIRDEYLRIRARFVDHLDEQAEDLARRSEAARLRRQQIELES